MMLMLVFRNKFVLCQCHISWLHLDCGISRDLKGPKHKVREAIDIAAQCKAVTAKPILQVDVG
jgi:hypothetical protein